MDIDNFKIINDTYGHDTGDRVLKSFSTAILNICRKNDICSRTGGEEFTIFLPNTKIEQCEIISERIRKKISELSITFEDITFSFTTSIGICYSNSKNHKEQIFKNADSALYEAKKSGKNQVKIFK